MLDKLLNAFLMKGYMKLSVREEQVRVVFELTGEGVHYLCFIDDTENWLKLGLAARISENVRRILQTNEKFAKYANSACDGMTVVVTNDPEHTRGFLDEGDAYWLIHQPTRRLMIYEDQPGDFCGAKAIIEDCLKQNAIRMALAQLKGLYSPANVAIIAINILVYIVLECMGSCEDASFMHSHGAMAVYDIMYANEYYRLFTSAFLHFGVAHLLYNMIALLYLGRPLEKSLGTPGYLVVYVVGAVGANAVSVAWYLHQGAYFTVSAGASGAICAVAGALAFILLKNRKENKSFTFVRWAIFVALVAGQGIGDSTVNNAAHIGGLVIGFVLGAILYMIKTAKVKNRKRI